MAAVTVTPGQEQRARSPIGGDVTFLARGEQTNGTAAVLAVRVPPGEGPPLHIHSREDEWIHVLEGEMRWKLGDEIRATPAGSFVFIPRGLAHCFQNIGPEPSMMLVTFAPAGMEGFFDRLATQSSFDLEEFRRAGAEHGMEIVGPPLAQLDPR